jgi:hypothetical protein
MRTAFKAAAVGMLLGAYFVVHDHSTEWWSAADPLLAAARIFGGMVGGAILIGSIGYAIGLRRNR